MKQMLIICDVCCSTKIEINDAWHGVTICLYEGWEIDRNCRVTCPDCNLKTNVDEIMLFYLGTHKANWLAKTETPLFISRRTLEHRRSFPRALGLWALDSGGFTELSMFGEWKTSARDYVEYVRRFSQEIGNLSFASPRDYMCEPFMIEKTGLSVLEHQKRTVDDYQDLISRAPDLPFIPVLQGWELSDYQRCLELYERAGVDLASLPLVGLGSVCRRQHTAQVAEIASMIASKGIRLHGFGFKTKGLPLVSNALYSADSMAWSYQARYLPALPECPHKTCANCLIFAEQWRGRVLSNLSKPTQLRFLY